MDYTSNYMYVVPKPLAQITINIPNKYINIHKCKLSPVNNNL